MNSNEIRSASPWLDVKGASAWSKFSDRIIRDALKNGDLRGNRTSDTGPWRIHVDDVDAWLRGEPAASKPDRITRKRAS